MKRIMTLAAISAALLMPAQSKAQAPLYAGFTGSSYALESRFDNTVRLTEIGKTFPSNVPMWIYLGIPVNTKGLDKPFYGVGASINYPNHLHVLPTLEGFGESFTGITCYSSIELKDKWGIDVVPHLDKNLNYDRGEFTFYKSMFGITLGATSNFEKTKWTGISNTDLRAGLYLNGCNITGDANFKKKNARIAFQKNW